MQGHGGVQGSPTEGRGPWKRASSVACMVRTAQPPCRCRRNAMVSIYREALRCLRSRATTQTGGKLPWAGRGPLPLQQAAHGSAASSAVRAKLRHRHQPAPAAAKRIAQALLQSPPHSRSATRGPRPRRLSETVEERLACLLDAAEYIRRLAHELQQSQPPLGSGVRCALRR